MQIILDTDETWSLMSLITSYVIDNSGVSPDGKQRVRAWRTARPVGSVQMEELAATMNGALGGYIVERTTRTIRQSGRYQRSKAGKR